MRRGFGMSEDRVGYHDIERIKGDITMAKTKKVSIKSIEAAVEENTKDTVSVDFNGLEICVKRSLSFYEMLSLVRDVVSGCFNDDDGAYIPEVKSFLIRIYVLMHYTNINIPQNIEKKYEFAYKPGLFEAVIESINRVQFVDICNAIDESIGHIVDSNIREMQNQFTSIQNAVKELAEKVMELFNGIDSGDIEKVFDAVTERGVDEGKLMEAYIKEKNNNS